MKQKPIIRLPQLYDAGGDVSKKWFVYYSCRNPKSQRMERFKEFSGLKLNMKAADRYAVGKKLIIRITEKLKNGWTPFNDPSVVYPDNLQYQTAIKEYRRAVALNGTFDFYSSKFLDELKLAHEDATISSYRSKLRMFNAWLQGLGLDQCDVSTFDNDLLTKFFLFIIKERKLSKNTVKKYNQILYNTFQLICKERKPMQNPVFEMPTTKILNESAPFPIRENHIATITKALQERDPQLLFASKFLFYCSIRPGNELRFLTIGNLDLFRGTINVSASRAKKRLSRIVTIPQHFLDELLQMGLDKLPSKYYLLSHHGSPGPTHLGKNTLRNRWFTIRKNLNLPDYYKFYSWKHTGNVCAADAGIPLRQIQLQNGHSSIRTTEIYMKNKAGNINTEVKNSWPSM
jgi:integrase